MFMLDQGNVLKSQRNNYINNFIPSEIIALSKICSDFRELSRHKKHNNLV